MIIDEPYYGPRSLSQAEANHSLLTLMADRPTEPIAQPSSPLPSMATTQTAALPAVQDEHEDPQITPLKAMFPDLDNTVLLSVLESVHGNQDRAIDMLLGMSDPEYVSKESPAPSQSDLDEQLARRLALEEEQQHHAAWEAQQQSRQYTPRNGSRTAQQQQGAYQPQPPARDTMAEFQDQFSKIAESGKRTFGSLISKVKAKVQEFDQQRNGQGSSSRYEPQWDPGAMVRPTQQYEQPVPQQQPYYDPNPRASHEPAIMRHQDVGYDAIPDPIPAAPSPNYTSNQSQGQQANSSSQSPVQSPSHSQAPSAAESTSAPVVKADVGHTKDTRPASPPAATSETPRSSTSTPAANIDYSKLGLLPKRPVSLLRDPAAEVRTKPSDEDDDLEYAENPFEDRHR